jgi:hypothetical protein
MRRFNDPSGVIRNTGPAVRPGAWGLPRCLAVIHAEEEDSSANDRRDHRRYQYTEHDTCYGLHGALGRAPHAREGSNAPADCEGGETNGTQRDRGGSGARRRIEAGGDAKPRAATAAGRRHVSLGRRNCDAGSTADQQRTGAW